MKKVIFIIISAMLISKSFATEIIVKPELQKVIVFLKAAELNYSAKVKLEKGINEVILSDISNNIDRNSVNVSGKGDGVIISVALRFDYLREASKNPEIQNLQQTLDDLNKKIMTLQNDNDLLNYELEIFLANKNVKNDKVGVSISEIQKVKDYLISRIRIIKNQLLENNLSIKKYNSEIEKVKKQLDELNNQSNKPANEILVTVSANKSGIFELNISYVLLNAGWTPNYNIYVDNIKTNAKLSYIANIWQNSGSDWKDVEIILSTRNPNRNNTKPELFPWYLDFYSPLGIREPKSNIYKAVTMEQSMSIAEPSLETMADYFEVDEKQLSIEFKPTLKYDIPSDNKPHSVSLKDTELNSVYRYYAVPKLDENAFLVMKIENWNNLNLLPGEANIFYENSFVGKTYLNPNTEKDSLLISLGRDENIVVNRKSLKDFTEEKFLSSDVERIYTYELKIKNNKKTNIDIIVEDQFPISKQEEITVKLKEADNAIINNEIGTLTWNLKINASESITKKYSFSIRYPKDKKIQGM